MSITALGIVGPPGPPGPQGAAGAVEASNTLDVAGGVLTSDGKLTWLTTKRDGGPTDYAIARLTAAGIGTPPPVASVNGLTGAVVLTAADVGAAPADPAPALAIRLPTFGTFPTTGNGPLVKTVANNAAKYHLATWLPATWPGTDPITTWGGPDEGHIRPPATVAFGLAALLATGAYDATATGVSSAAATTQAVRLCTSLAATHRANGGSWGGLANTPPPTAFDDTPNWQVALWATRAAQAGWLLWPNLSATQQAHLCAMVIHEAGRMLAYRVPSYQNAAGTVLFPGDSKAEENSWNAGILHLACQMLPDHPLAPTWLAKAVELSLSAGATPADLIDTTTRVHGLTLPDVLDGSNLNSDDTVTNHGIIHPQYMAATIIESLGWGYAAGAVDVPAGAIHHLRDIWRAFPTLQPAGWTSTMYQAGSGAIYFPQGNDWGSNVDTTWYAITDLMAAQQGWDSGLATSAATWAGRHLQVVADMQARFTDGHTYLDATENSYAGREQEVLGNAGTMAAVLTTPAWRVSAAPVDLLTMRNRRR